MFHNNFSNFMFFSSKKFLSQKTRKARGGGEAYIRGGGPYNLLLLLIIRLKSIIVSTYIFKKTFNFTFQISNGRGLS